MTNTNIDTDRQYRETKVAEVEDQCEGWSVKSDDGWSLWVPGDKCQQPPAVGETMRCYGKGLGCVVRGIVINGRVYRYRSESEAESDRRVEVAAIKKQKADDYEAKRADFDARVLALPEPFRLRLERFRDIGGNGWRYDFEPYELFSCEQAVVFTEATGSPEELKAFAALAYDDQRRRVPKMDDGHSGNTFGQACALASCFMTNPELVLKMHGAMCPLVGCEAYGCFAAHEAKRGIAP